MGRGSCLRWLTAGLLGLLVACSAKEEAGTPGGGVEIASEAGQVNSPDSAGVEAGVTAMTPQQVFERMQEAMLARDAGTLYSMRDPDEARRDGITLEALEAAMKAPELPEGWAEITAQEVAATRIDGDMATLTIRKPDGTEAQPFRLRRVQGEWKLVGQ